jgi:hypothetical protein
MKNFILGILIGSFLTGAMAVAQNEDFYGRPQWGRKTYPPSDSYGRPNQPPVENHLKQRRGEPC